MDIWKPIKNYEGLYEINDNGEIHSLGNTIMRSNGRKQTFKPRIVKAHNKGNDRMMVSLVKNKKSKCFLVHRLLGNAFIPNPDNKPQINHKDGDPLNNNLSNLEWVTQSENIEHALKNGFMNLYVLSLSEEKEIIKKWKTGKYSKSSLSREYPASRYTIRRIVNDERKYKRK